MVEIWKFWKQETLTEKSDSASRYFSGRDSEPELAIGVAGKECVAFSEGKRTLLRENDLEVVGLSKGPSDDGVSGIIRTVFSPSSDKFLALKLLWGSRFFIDLNFTEGGLGGNPALVEVGLVAEEISILVKAGDVFSRDLTGICKDDRFGRLDCWTKEAPSPSSFWLLS